jgi:hypothetical protein
MEVENMKIRTIFVVMLLLLALPMAIAQDSDDDDSLSITIAGDNETDDDSDDNETDDDMNDDESDDNETDEDDMDDESDDNESDDDMSDDESDDESDDNETDDESDDNETDDESDDNETDDDMNDDESDDNETDDDESDDSEGETDEDDSEELDDETVEETEDMGSLNGAKMRMYQLERSIAVNLAAGNVIVTFGADKGYDVAELEAILSSIKSLLEEVQGYAYEGTSEEMAVDFVEFKEEAIMLSKDFRNGTKDVFSTGETIEIKRQIQEAIKAVKDEYKGDVTAKIREHNAERVSEMLRKMAVEMEGLAEQVQSGEVSAAEAKKMIMEQFREMSMSEKKKAESVAKELEARKKVAEKALKAKAEEIEQKIQEREQRLEQIKERLKNDEVLREQIKGDIEELRAQRLERRGAPSPEMEE